MEDKELLELAAKAAGMFVKKNFYGIDDEDQFVGLKVKLSKESPRYLAYLWNPLTDDGDALRLAVKLDMNIEVWNPFKEVWAVAEGYDVIEEPWGEDKLAATRRAIVRAASEIGRGMG